MQELFQTASYDGDMAKTATPSKLRALREAAGLSVRELARQLDENHTNIIYWETSGNLPRSNVLIPMAKALGVTVEELLGEPKTKRANTPGSKLGAACQEAMQLPRRQQEKLAEFIKVFVTQHSNDKAA